MSGIAGVMTIAEATTVMTELQNRGFAGIATAFGEAIRRYVDDESDSRKAVVLVAEMKMLMRGL